MPNLTFVANRQIDDRKEWLFFFPAPPIVVSVSLTIPGGKWRRKLVIGFTSVSAIISLAPQVFRKALDVGRRDDIAPHMLRAD